MTLPPETAALVERLRAEAKPDDYAEWPKFLRDDLNAAAAEITRLAERCAELERRNGQLTEAINEMGQERAALEGKLKSINRITSPGSRTLDEMIRDMGYACDIARSGLASPPDHPATSEEETRHG